MSKKLNITNKQRKKFNEREKRDEEKNFILLLMINKEDVNKTEKNKDINDKIKILRLKAKSFHKIAKLKSQLLK